MDKYGKKVKYDKFRYKKKKRHDQPCHHDVVIMWNMNQIIALHGVADPSSEREEEISLFLLGSGHPTRRQ